MYLTDLKVNREGFGQFERDEVTVVITLVGPAEQFALIAQHLHASVGKDVNVFLVEPIVKP